MGRYIHFAFGLASGMALAVLVPHAMNSRREVKVHTLDEPLVLLSNRDDSDASTNKPTYLLPPGTTLYLDRGFPEGFTRYKVYVNVDRMPLKLRSLADPYEIDPLEARALDEMVLRQGQPSIPCTPGF